MRSEYAPVAKAQVHGDVACDSSSPVVTRRHVLCAVLSLTFGAAIFVAMVYFAHTDAFVSMVNWVQHHKLIGSVVYVSSFAIFLILCFPSTVFELLAGYIFGFWLGLLLATTGKLLGTIASFLIGRYLCRERVLAFMDRAHPAWQAFRALVRKKQVLIVFLTRIAIFPIAIKNYGLGVLDVSILVFVSAALLTGLPFSVLWVYSGHSAKYVSSLLSEGDGQNTTKVVLLIVGATGSMLLVGIVGYSMRKHVLMLAEQEAAMTKDETNYGSESSSTEVPILERICV